MAILCWDFDGTIALSHHLWSSSVKKAIDLVVPDNNINFLDIRKCMETGFSWHTPETAYPERTGDKWWKRMNKHFYKSYIYLGVSEPLAKTASEKVKEIILTPENYIIYETAIKTLQKAKELGHTNVILSNNFPELEQLMNSIGIAHYFDSFTVSACIGYEKPRKEIFEKAKEPYSGEKFYMIGDSVKADIIGGKNAGMKTILVHKGHSKEADYCVDKLIDILKII
ncbi:MAG: HAD-IA family hydrolase [Clostridia bacterium]|nr:HAD-IA family hydrolase [Clostridia bacterium]